jgi:DHA1 family bicyclomycin/chloramphenicol resistance-like MFS transporter
LAILILISGTSTLSSHLYAPSLPHLPGYFGTSAAAVKMTLSLNILAFGLSQLIWGPLSDRFGRRPVMLGGMSAFVVFSMACAFAMSISQLIAARICQGVVAAIPAVLVLAIIFDLYDTANRVRALAVWGMAIALTPAFAPIIGGYVYLAFGWRANFVLVAFLGMLTTAFIWRRLPESSIPDKKAIAPKQILVDYWKLLTNRGFVSYAVMLGTANGAILAFVTAGPFIFISYYGVATQYYGLYQAVLVLAYIIGSLIAKQLSGKINLAVILQLGLTFSAAGSIALATLVFTNTEGPFSLIAAAAALVFGTGPVFAVGPVQALNHSKSRTGVGSAMVNAIQMFIAGLASVAVGIFHDGTSRPLAVTILVLLVITGIAYRVAIARKMQVST